MSTVKEEVQKLQPDALIELYQLDATGIGGDILYFHGNTSVGPIWWQGVEYYPYPLQVEGFARTSEKPPQPKLIVGNIEGVITQLCLEFQDMVGSKFTRIRTFGRFLDAMNFGKKNLLIHSEAHDNGAWGKSGLSITANAATAPNGAITSERVVISGAGHFIGQSVTVDPGQDYTLSTHVAFESIPASAFRMGVYDSTNAKWIALDALPDVSDVSGDWKRAELTFKIPANCTTIMVYPFYNSSAVNGSILLWGSQLELGLFATEYEPKDLIGRNPDANPEEEMPREVWFVERKSSETSKAVEFELVTAFELNGVMLPRRQVVANYCAWMSLGGYRGPYCGYTGPAVAKADDTPTSDLAQDKCSGKISGCKLRKWPDDVLNFGGFPAAGLARV